MNVKVAAVKEIQGVLERMFKILCYLQSEKNMSRFSTKLMHFCKKNTTCIGLQAEQIFSVIIQYTYFFNFEHGFWGSFSMLFPKAPVSCDKKKLK